MTREIKALRKEFISSIAGYPYVTPARFDDSYLLQSIQAGHSADANTATIEAINPDTIQIKKTHEAVLPGSGENGPMVPVYEISFRTTSDREYIFNERYAVIGYGSNVSPNVLARKFGPQNYKGDPLCPVLMVDIKGHSVVASACISAAGNVPVTLLQTVGTDTKVGLSFYRACQLEQMTQTEPNYDLVLLKEKNILSMRGVQIECQAMVYQSIWGGLLSHGNVLRNDCIPHSKNCGTQTSTLDAMRLAYAYVMEENRLRESWLTTTGQKVRKPSFENWVMSLRTQLQDSEAVKAQKLLKRLAANTLLVAHSFAKNLDATVLKPAQLHDERVIITRKIGRDSSLPLGPRFS